MSNLAKICATSLWSSVFFKRSSICIKPGTRLLTTDAGHTNISVGDLDLKIEEKANETYVEVLPFKTGREGKVIDVKSDKACALCKLNLRNLNYTDVMILSQYLRRDGSLLTYHESKLCTKQYKTIQRLVRQAQRCNLIKRPSDYLVPGPWHDFNTYIEPDRKRDQPMKIVKKEYWKM